MTTPRHHVPRDLLANYVAGNTNEAVSLVVACHVTLCGSCAGEHARLERTAGATLETATPVEVGQDLLTRTLERLDDAAAPPQPPRTQLTDAALPAPLLRALDRGGHATPRWKRVVPGIEQILLPVATPGATARLLRLAPGATVPMHGHEGDELVAVFSGGIEDGDQLFERGDVELRGAGDRHDQRIRLGVPCVALVVNHGALVPLTWRGRLFKLIFGI